MVVHSSVGGPNARIRLVNPFASSDVRVDHATIAVQASGATPAGPPVDLRFGGGLQTVIPHGGEVYSDDASGFTVPADRNLIVSIHLPDAVSSPAYHAYALTSSYAAADGADHAADQGPGAFTTAFDHWAYLGGIDVTAAPGGGTIVALGDSQTDGGATTKDANRRWVNDYARTLLAQGSPLGVVDMGISGNSLTADAPDTDAAHGVSAKNRFERDVLHQPGVRSVILYEGINDIAYGGASDSTIEAAIHDLAGRAHGAGLSFTAATIPPFGGHPTYTPAKDQVRACVNAYLRATADVDRVVDFDQATRDPLAPEQLFAGYYNPANDHLHLNDNGNQVLADTVLTPPAPAGVTLNFAQTVAGDFTGSGRSDLIAVDSTGTLYRWPGHGDGTFGAPVKLTAGWTFTQTTAADFTSDGIADLVAKDATGTLYLWSGNRSGTFSLPVRLTGGWNFTQTTAADFTSDGIADLVAKDATGTLYLWSGNRSGTFSLPVRLTGGWNFTQTTAADFTGDGIADLVARDDTTGTLYHWAGHGDGTFGGRAALLTGWGPDSQTTASTFRGTGRADLIARDDTTGELREWDNTGGAAFSRPLRITAGW
ncbi:hypothetical protein CFP65_4436 [Kitasatospora sp. MMS16-BH015]|uniref:FG-GAP-like repeat-containing protein n=1 Tax=Kitasatospora sp. MMS16-BH015 TaxID=2018025 RepID=UPI000CA26085|nr:FG-GAP-like repeat-containing protein [Kitasatospora sp. MMS16-BH015]AUG79183.1 hypothetical protein CFP65_4436 [Kitasatospora sp. MMS16-BH015]